MIYVSTSCVRAGRIGQAIELLAKNGFTNIELSAGTHYYDGIFEDVFGLKKKYSLSYIIHNYFPPPCEHFVLNLASLNDEVYRKSLAFLKETIILSKKLGVVCFALHAGFFIDLSISELGGNIPKKAVFDKEKATDRFCDGFRLLQKSAEGSLNLYIENNVLQDSVMSKQCPFMLVDSSSYFELKRKINFNLLLDIGHLKVSCQSLSLDFKEEVSVMASHSNYFHLSDNNGFTDEHGEISEGNRIWDLIKPFITKDRTFTLEIGGIDALRGTHDILVRNLH